VQLTVCRGRDVSGEVKIRKSTPYCMLQSGGVGTVPTDISTPTDSKQSPCAALFQEFSGFGKEIVNIWSKSKSHYDRQSVGQSGLVSGAHLGPAANFSSSLRFSLDSCGFVIL
jgi:hypothetical protein